MPGLEFWVELEKEGPLVRVSAPPEPSVNVSTRVRPVNVTLPLFSTVIV